MEENQLKPIEEKEEINLPKVSTPKEEPKIEHQETITILPSWNIEPPLEIKRGN